MKQTAFLMVLTGVGNYAYKRPEDGVLVTHRLLEGLAGTTVSDVPCLQGVSKVFVLIAK